MSALPENIIPFALPKKPRIKEKVAPPDQRTVCVMPFRAVADRNLTDGGIRVLAALCSYCNKAGITWVSQKKLAEDLGCTRQAITNQIAQLRHLGYVEVVSKGWKGAKPNTLRVIFDPTMTAQDAIAITSSKEDTRPPEMKEKEERQMNEEVDREGQRRIAQMLANALKNPNPKKEYAMPKDGQTKAVREIKEANQKALQRRSKTVDKSVDGQPNIGQPAVSNESSPEVSNVASHRQPIGQAGVSYNTGNTVSSKSIKVSIEDSFKRLNTVQGNRNELKEAGMTDEQIEDAEATLIPLFAAEGITPSVRVLTEAILQLHRDAA